jgi:hypothetical protein
VRRNQPIARIRGAALVLGMMAACASAARADVALDGIKMTYHGGRLIQHVKVVPLLYGSSWVRRNTPTFIKNYLNALFTDGRFMANLAQYSTGGFQIGNGSAVDPVTDLAVLGKVDADHAYPGIHYQVSDDQIQAELKAQITAGKLPKPDADTLYVVCTQYDTIVTLQDLDSVTGFGGYHQKSDVIGAPYCVIAPTGLNPAIPADTPTGYSDSLFNRQLTADMSHELAEAITDPDITGESATAPGWNADNVGFGGEVADIPALLNGIGYITDDQFYDLLVGPDGTKYAVQKIWSVKDRAPTAFATATATTP